MRLRKAIFTNFCKFRRLELNFDFGLVGIVGRNGTGKTTITNGIFACLTNSFDRFPGVKEDSINNLAGPKDESSIYIEAEHNDSQFSVYRALRALRGTPSHCLTVDGIETTGAPGVQAGLEKLLGVKRSLLDTYVFVDQWDMFAFLNQAPGDRASTYQLLCGTEKAEKIYQAIGRLLEQDAGLFAGVNDNSDALRLQLAEQTETLNQAQASRKAIAAGKLTEVQIDLANSYIRKREIFERCTAEHQAACSRCSQRKPQLAAALAAKTGWETLMAQSTGIVADLRAQADAARGALGQLKQYRDTDLLRQKLQARLKQLDGVIKTRKPVKLNKDDPGYDAAMLLRSQAQSRFDRNRQILATFDSTGLVECPTCGTPVSHLGERLLDLRGAVSSDSIIIRDTTVAIETIEAARRDKAAYDSWLAVQQQMIVGVASQLKGLAELAPPQSDEAVLKQVLADFDRATTDLRTVEANFIRDNAILARLEAANVEDLRQKAVQAAHLVVNVIPDNKLESARKALARHQLVLLQLATLDGRLAELQGSVTRLQADIDSTAVRLARGARAAAFGDKLRTLREEVFHRTKLPQAVAQTNLKDMEADIAGVLQDFGSPFRVQTSENLTFTACFPGEPPQAAARLSGGQKAVLATAFRVAVLSLFGADLGLMALDEPTAGLDGDNVGYLADALARYATQVRGRRQVFLITHSPELTSAFDQVIDLNAI